MAKRIPDGTPVTVTGYTDPETGDPAEDRQGVVISGGHTVDGVEAYDVQVEGDPYPGLIEVARVKAAK